MDHFIFSQVGFDNISKNNIKLLAKVNKLNEREAIDSIFQRPLLVNCCEKEKH